MVLNKGGQPPVAQPVWNRGDVAPDRLYCFAPGLQRTDTRKLAMHAAEVARALCPRLSGRAAAGIKPYWGDGFFGVKWDVPYLWHQEAGISSFTMNNLAGKTIPMWIDDWTGELARADPKAKTRITANGRRQILIFRKAAKFGERKRVPVRGADGRILRWRDVPKSYPGAPGRIVHREWRPVGGTTGRIARVVNRTQVGVRWRHPGLMPREFLQYAIQTTALSAGIKNTTVYAAYRRR